MRRTTHGWRLGLGAGALLLVTPIATVASISQANGATGATGAARTASATSGSAAAGPAPTVNWALAGSATATTAETNNPASNAVDGDAGTDWCTSGWTGTLTVDL